jgi:hypothetical protein
MRKMKIKKDNSKKRKKHPPVSAPKDPPSPTKADSYGVMKRFLDWLAKGAEKMNKSGSFCPT